MDFAFHAPFNSLSLGQCSINIAKEFHKRGFEPYIFSIGNDDFAAFQPTDDFQVWFNSCKGKSLKSYQRDIPVFKLWHLMESLGSLGKDQTLFTFYELDSPTEEEINTVRNNKTVLFSCSAAAKIFEQFGCENVASVPLGFDSESFHVIDKEYHAPDVIAFTLGGKLEKRKHHARIINWWAKKYGNNPKYTLNCLLYNAFLPVELQNNLIAHALEGKEYFNINFIPFLQGNDAFNDFLNNGDIDLSGLSGGEGWNLIPFTSMCLGKYPIVLNCSGMKDWATKENSILVNPKGKEPAYDGVFFKEGMPFNQGNIFNFGEEGFYQGCEEAIKRYQANKVNQNGIDTAANFTWENTASKILEYLK